MFVVAYEYVNCLCRWFNWSKYRLAIDNLYRAIDIWKWETDKWLRIFQWPQVLGLLIIQVYALFVEVYQFIGDERSEMKMDEKSLLSDQ